MKERVIQFGEGGFLRSFVDVFINKMNEQGLFGGNQGEKKDKDVDLPAEVVNNDNPSRRKRRQSIILKAASFRAADVL